MLAVANICMILGTYTRCLQLSLWVVSYL